VSDWRPNLGVGLLKERAETIVSECQQRVKEIDAILTDINRMEKESQLAALKALAIPDQSDVMSATSLSSCTMPRPTPSHPATTAARGFYGFVWSK